MSFGVSTNSLILSTQFNRRGGVFGFTATFTLVSGNSFRTTLFHADRTGFAFTATFTLVSGNSFRTTLFHADRTGFAFTATFPLVSGNGFRTTLFHADRTNLALSTTFLPGHVQSIFTASCNGFSPAICTAMSSGFRSGIRTAVGSPTCTAVTACLIPVIVLNGIVLILCSGIESVPYINLFSTPYTYQIFEYHRIRIQDFQFGSFS